MPERERSLSDWVLAGLHAGPERVALREGGQALTYAQLHVAALRIGAQVAVAQGEPQPPVGVLTGTTSAAAQGILAALYAGAAAVPLSPRFPQRRTAEMIRAAGVRTVIVDHHTARVAAALPGVRTVPVESVADPGPGVLRDAPHGVTGGALAAPRAVRPDEIAYIMFTSGSTGRPKGVPITHRNAGSFLDAAADRYPFTPDDVVAQTFEPTFDLFMFGMFMAWGSGACAVTVPSSVLGRLPRFAERNGVSVWFSVPSSIRLAQRLGVLDPGSLPGVRWSLFCGEALLGRDAKAWYRAAPAARLENLYGPTELTIACTAFGWSPGDRLGGNGTVPMGKPFPGMDYVLVDEHGRPSGDEGELCMSGPQMFGGYLDQADDEERFLALDGRRWYRTGDRVGRMADGVLVYLGRLDHQVKIRGHRVELLEVDHALRQLEGVTDGVAFVVDDRDGEHTLAAAYTGTRTPTGIPADLSVRLPDYMVPSVIRRLDALPLNVNGKVDRAGLAGMAQGAPDPGAAGADDRGAEAHRVS